MGEYVGSWEELEARASRWGPTDVLRTTDPTSCHDEYLAEHQMHGSFADGILSISFTGNDD